MERTPEEIKKGLEFDIGCCSNCYECSSVDNPYRCKDRANQIAVAEDALEYIRQMEEQVPKWISVEERLPEEGGKYIVCTENGAVYCTRFRRFGDGGTFGVDINTHIAYWMPLPEGPKEG